VVASVWTLPAGATEETVTATAPSVKAVSTIERRPGPSRIAPSGPIRHATPMADHLDCTGSWCGRHFVLIIGVGY
jgi:hypothetical protein